MNYNKSLIIAHLKKFGLKPVNNINYMQWAYNELYKEKITKTKIDNLFFLLKKMSNATYKEKKAFYSYISAYKVFINVVHSIKFEAIANSGVSVINDKNNYNHILDFGCNVGYLSSFYAKYYKKSYIIGFDNCNAAIKRATSFYKKIDNLSFIFSYEKLSDNFYDLIIDTQCLATINNKYVLRLALKNLYKKSIKDVKLISISPFNNFLEMEQFINEMVGHNFYVSKLSPIFFKGHEFNEVLTKLVFTKHNNNYQFSAKGYFLKIREELGI